jgi:hypothetical protein
METSCQFQVLTVSHPEKRHPVPTGWAPQAVWTPWGRENLFNRAGNRTLGVHPVACHYTDRAITTLPTYFIPGNQHINKGGV